MPYVQNRVHTLYKKLLALYPRRFREQVGASMEQTFHDLCNEQIHRTSRGFFVLSIFSETPIGIVHEHLLLFLEGHSMKNILLNPGAAAITSILLSLPLGFIFVAFMFDIQPLIKPLNLLLIIFTWGGLMLEEIYCIQGIRCD